MGREQEVVTDINKSPLIHVLSWMFVVISVFSVAARTGTKLYMVKTLKLDDWLALSATVTTICYFISVVVQATSGGLGKHKDALNAQQISHFLKSGYAADVLFITSLAFAKISGALTVVTIAKRQHKKYLQAAGAVVLVWAVSGIFVVFFQCELPTPWDFIGRKCIQRPIFWTVFSAINIVTDLAVLAVMGINVARIQTIGSKKILVMGVFGSRIFVTPAIVAQIYYALKTLNSQDPTFDMWQLAIAMQVQQCLNILTICIPNLKPFLDSLESGQLRGDDMRRQGKSSSGGNGSYQYRYRGGGVHSGAVRSGAQNSANVLATATSQKSKLFEMVDMPKSRAGTSSSASPGVRDKNVAWDGQSHTSQTILIQQTWNVDVETR